MLNKRRLFNLAAILLVAAFCFGLVRLLVLRYTTGDVFPAYSSHRPDPLGTKVLYESLRALPGLDLARNERPLARLGTGEGATLFLLGTKDGSVPDKTREAIENFVRTGGRLVLTLYPRYDDPPRKQRSPTPSPSPNPADAAEAAAAGISLTELLKRWQLGQKEDRDDEDDIAIRKTPLPLEENLSWHSGLAFTPLHLDWRTIYEAKRGPVIVERNFDAGTVVVAGDSFFVSNEALLAERAPALLAWLAGPQRRIIFDESHLNVRENPGVATLLRRYGLSGFVIGLLVLIALWLWRNATFSLAPRRASAPNDELVSGRDSFTGFVQLLRRGIAPKQLVDLCVAEWKKSAGSDRTKLSEEPASDSHDPVAAYNNISARLRTKKWKTTSLS